MIDVLGSGWPTVLPYHFAEGDLRSKVPVYFVQFHERLQQILLHDTFRPFRFFVLVGKVPNLSLFQNHQMVALLVWQAVVLAALGWSPSVAGVDRLPLIAGVDCLLRRESCPTSW